MAVIIDRRKFVKWEKGSLFRDDTWYAYILVTVIQRYYIYRDTEEDREELLMHYIWYMRDMRESALSVSP